ncbi:MAG: UbiD family decarboxylase [Rikenellaceae bacterium]
MYKNLQEYVDLLEKKGELKRIKERISSDLEIAALTDKECKSSGGGKALLFENTDKEYAVLTNMMGSDSRIRLAIGCDSLSELSERIMGLFSAATSPKKSLWDKVKMLPLATDVSNWMPKYKSGKGECQKHTLYSKANLDSGSEAAKQMQEQIFSKISKIVDSKCLDLLPILKSAPYDGGRFVTLPLVNTISPLTGVRNIGMYRMQQIDSRTTGMHWHIHKTGARHYEQYKDRGEIMPVTVVLGGDPAYTYAATAPLPEGIDEYLLAGFLRGKAVELVKCTTNDLYIPTDCDFVIEGYVDPSEEKFWEGPFGDHTGFYSLEDYYPKFHVTHISARENAIYPATLVGVPPMEDAYIAKATEALFLAPIRLVMQPEITDMWLPQEGVAHNLAIINIQKKYIGQAQKVALSMWGAGQMMFNKFSIITSFADDVDIRNCDNLKKAIEYIDIDRDVIIAQGTLDVLDHTSDECGFGGKLSIDATIKEKTTITPFSVARELPQNIDSTYAENGWSTLFAYINKDANFKVYTTTLIDVYSIKGVKFLILLDKDCQNLTINEKIWLLCSNCDAKRDTYITNGILVFDCRIKAGGINGFSRRWPNIVEPQSEILSDLNSGNSAEYI